MNFGDLQARAQLLASFEGYTDSQPAAEWDSLVNRGYLDFAWDTEVIKTTDTFVTVEGQALYPVEMPYFKDINQMIYTSAAGLSSVALWQSSDMREYQNDELWLVLSPGQPTRYILPSPNVIQLVPPPSAGGDTVLFTGTRAPNALVNMMDVPAFPDTWHEAIALQAAIYQMEVWSDDNGRLRLEDFRQRYASEVEGARKYMSGQRYGGSLQRRVRWNNRDRVFAKGYPYWPYG